MLLNASLVYANSSADEDLLDNLINKTGFQHLQLNYTPSCLTQPSKNEKIAMLGNGTEPRAAAPSGVYNSWDKNFDWKEWNVKNIHVRKSTWLDDQRKR